jgi:epoxide hydrolase-like predicted phosphatase
MQTGNSKWIIARRVAAFIAALSLLVLAASSMITLLIGGEGSTELALRLLAAAVFLPILLFLFAWAIGRAPGKPADNSSQAAGDDPTEEEVPRIRTVVLDIGGVLVGFDFREFISGKGNDEEMTERMISATVHSPWWKEYDRGNMSDDEIMDKFCEDAPDIADDIRRTFADIDGLLTRREETIPWIRALKAAGYQILLLSNYSQRALDGCPDANDFLDEVDGGILSFRDHVIKPDHEIYELLMERYDLVPEETVFVDDTPANIDAARELGWYGVVWENRQQVEEDLHALGVNW